MGNQIHNFFPVKEVTSQQVARRQVIFLLLMFLFAFLSYLRTEKSLRTQGDSAPMIITAIIFIPLIILVIVSTRTTIQITIDLVSKTFTADYFGFLGQSKTVTLDLYKSSIIYDQKTNRGGSYWELNVYEDIISKWFKVREGKNSYPKEQLDEIYSLLQPYQQNANPVNNANPYLYSAVFIALIFSGILICVLYAFHQPATLFFIGGICLVIGIIGLVFFWINVMPAKKANYSLSWFLVIALVFLSAFFIGQLKHIYVKDQLKKHGVTTNGLVLDAYQIISKKSRRHFAKISFGTEYHSYFRNINNEKGIYRTGDTLKVLFSSINPEIFIIVGHKAPAYTVIGEQTSISHTVFTNKNK